VDCADHDYVGGDFDVFCVCARGVVVLSVAFFAGASGSGIFSGGYFVFVAVGAARVSGAGGGVVFDVDGDGGGDWESAGGNDFVFYGEASFVDGVVAVVVFD